MIMADMLKQMGSNSPPFQPFINRCARVYEEKQISWNPVCTKKDALFYQFETGDFKDCAVELLPDACLNVLFECDESSPRAMFSGTFLEPGELVLKPFTTYFGFKPYSNMGLRSQEVQLSELVHNNIDFSRAFPKNDCLMEKILYAASFEERIEIFNSFAHEQMIDHEYSPTFIDYFTMMICSSRGSLMLNNLEQVTGYTERYCREKFKDMHGVSPKQYSSIMRFQNVLKALISNNYSDQSSLACDNGYFDQAHLIRDFKKFTLVSPERFRRFFHSPVEAVKSKCG